MFQYISCYSLSRWSIGLDISIQKFQYISCYSLSRLEIIFLNICKVSIHLMLLFIGIGENRLGKILSFNTSHVTLYPDGRRSSWSRTSCFNTSHVTLYRLVPAASPPASSFNTSHVTLYLGLASQRLEQSQFQYISCYSLSDMWRQECGEYIGFNTSHVTLYHRADGKVETKIWFQYISCYSLSENRKDMFCSSVCSFNTSHVTLYLLSVLYFRVLILFQYISCYSLSDTIWFESFQVYGFNTSHVTLYRISAHPVCI